MNAYDLSREFWNWSFDNPEKVSVNHSAIYFFAIEHCNRLGWKEKFGFPSQMTMDAVGIKKHSTYIRYFNDLVEFGFFKLIQKSKNQYSSNIISLTNAMPKKDEALDKAFVKHGAKQTESMGLGMGQSKRSIDKQINKETIEPINNEQTNNARASFESENLLIKEISKKFSLREMSPDFKKVAALVRYFGKIGQAEVDYLAEQHLYYHKYKDKTGSIKHENISRFIGESPFEDCELIKKDWKNKYQELNKSNGFDKRTDKSVAFGTL